MGFNIVLVEPEIPQNTGNIARTCSLTNTKLHLIKPLGFKIDDKHLKRAGLDYWSELDIQLYDSIEELYQAYPNGRFFYSTTKAEKYYSEFSYKDGDFFVFGKETAGIKKEIIEKNLDRAIKIPMKAGSKRSLNLANSVNIILYEAYRQIDFSF